MKTRDQLTNMHRSFFVVSVIAVYSMAILTTVSGGAADVVHICCYSTDPNGYSPNCYDCDPSVYKNALMACVNMTDLPKNISFKAANCMEKNCQIQIPKLAEVENVKMEPFLKNLISLLSQFSSRKKRSVFDNNVEGSERHVVKEVSTSVSPEEPTIKFIDMEYTEG